MSTTTQLHKVVHKKQPSSVPHTCDPRQAQCGDKHQHKMLPLLTRRHIAMMGLLYKIANGQAHQEFHAIFPAASPPLRSSSRIRTHHSKQLLDRCSGGHQAIMARSVFGLVRLWNILPQKVVDAPTVSQFQSQLSKCAMHLCKCDVDEWFACFSPGGATSLDQSGVLQFWYANDF